MPKAKLTLKGETKRLVLPVLALSSFLNSFKENALSAATFCSSAGVSTRSLPLLGTTPFFLQEASPVNKRINKSNRVLRFIRSSISYFHLVLFDLRIHLFERYTRPEVFLIYLNDSNRGHLLRPCRLIQKRWLKPCYPIALKSLQRLHMPSLRRKAVYHVNRGI